MVQDSHIAKIPVQQLTLDNENPRMSEFGLAMNQPEKDMLLKLWKEMGVDEIVYSIVSQGFWDYEPLIVMPIPNSNGTMFKVLEGNRRLAAVKIILDSQTYRVNLEERVKNHITPKLKEALQALPVIVVKSKEDAWRYIGFKHVNGPAKWGSFAKAKYIAEIHNEYGIPLDEIAFQLGDTHDTVRKLYQGLMVLDQAKKTGMYDYQQDIAAPRIYFSHLYTGLQREGIRSFLDLTSAESETPSPVPSERLRELGELLTWLYGKRGEEVDSVIKSQNPDLRNLSEVLESKEGLSALRAGTDLEYAHELSRSPVALFEDYLHAAKRSLQKARAYQSGGYRGEERILRLAGSIATMAEDIYNEIFQKYQENQPKGKKTRLTE